MLNAKANQFSLSPEGFILWQPKPENPLPGEPVARVVKGEHVLRPTLEVLENSLTQGIDRDSLKNNLTLWLNTHIGAVLEPLVFLGVQAGAEAEDPVQAICKTLYDSLGIVPRAVLEEQISKLDTEQRSVVRAKKIKLGPLLVFIPLLNKPAAVRLRGLLWSIDRGRPLPAPVPADGIVSKEIDESSADPDFFLAVGYPIYAGRAVRIDMLDRVINAIYDHAEKGKFNARHQMAEWLGCSIGSLYKILESMGHTKIYDPAEDPEKIVASTAAASVSEGTTEVAADAVVAPPKNEGPASEVKAEDSATTSQNGVAEAVSAEVKPELAVFRLKRGKAFVVNRGSDRQRPAKRFDQTATSPQQDEEGEGDRQGKEERGRSGGRFSRSKKEQHGASKRDGFSSEARSERGKKKGGGKDFKRGSGFDDSEREPRVISFEVKRKAEDSPFAILQKLKAKADE